MIFANIAILGAFLISIICGFLVIPQILSFCKKKQLYDLPNQRKVHHSLVPRLGGLAFVPSMMLASIIAVFVIYKSNPEQRIPLNLWSLYFCVSLIIIYFTGMIDDLVGLGAKIKFTAQILAACLLPLAGLYINNLYGLFGVYAIPFWISAPLTVFVIVFIVNAMNLIDGIDGLSAGLSILALMGYYLIYSKLGLESYCILIAGLMGVLVPYIYYNVFGSVENNRKIFMGDSGSLTLGFILSMLFVKYVMVNPDALPYESNHLVNAYALLIVPVFDVARVAFHRLRHHKPLYKADKNHIHHKLMKTGLSMHQTLVAILLLQVFFVAVNRILFPVIGTTGVVLLSIVLYTLFNLWISKKIEKKREK